MKYTKAELIAAIAKAHAAHAELVALFDAGQYSEPVAVGDTVTAKYGRGDKARDVTGNVIAIEGNQVLILSGFDTYKVFAKDVTLADKGEQANAPADPPAPTETPVLTEAKPDTTTQEPKDALAGAEVKVDPLAQAEKSPEEIHYERVRRTQEAVLTPEQFTAWLAANPSPKAAA